LGEIANQLGLRNNLVFNIIIFKTYFNNIYDNGWLVSDDVWNDGSNQVRNDT